MKNLNFLKIFTAAALAFGFVALEVNAYDANRIPRPMPTGTTSPLPDGWAFRDVGNITPQSDWCYNAVTGQYYLKSYGWNVWGTDDQLGFIYFQTDEDKQVVTRIMDAEVLAGTSQKGFIMIRSGLSNNNAAVYIETKTSNGGQVCFCWRLDNGGNFASIEQPSGTNGSTNVPPNAFPRWMKFIRQGQYVTAFHKDDVEGASWIKMDAVKKLQMTGKAYMGIGACGHLTDHQDNPVPAIMLFDNLTVTDIEIPYEVLGDESVDADFANNLKPGKTKDIDITKVFGHALGEYFTVEAESVDKSVADAYFWEKKATSDQLNKDAEEWRKYVRIKGLREGVTTIKLTCTINGYTMSTDYSLNVSNGQAKPKTANTSAPFGWELKNLEVPVEPNLVWGEPFVTKNLSISKKFPIFIGSWEYDWGGIGVGNFSKNVGNGDPTTVTSSEMYISGAEKYAFRDELFRYTKASGYAKDTIRGEVGGPSGSGIDLAFSTKNDTATYTGGKQELIFVVSKDPSGNVVWDECKGFWTERINYTDRSTGKAVRGIPYLTNISAGDWVSYTVYAPRSGYYSIFPVAACKEANKSIEVQVNGIVQIKNLSITKGSSGSDWKKGGTDKILLVQGKNQLKFVANDATFNLLGFKVLFSTPSKEPYAGITLDKNKYALPSQKVDTTLMTDEEKIAYDSILAIYPGPTELDKIKMDSIILTYPVVKYFDTDTVISRYKTQLDSMQIPYLTAADKSNALDTIRYKLTDSFDSITFVTTQQQTMKHIDVTSYLFKRGYDPKKPIEVSLKIDSIANTGRGTFMGIMLRSLLGGQVSPNSPAVSYGIGSFEGGRVSYRWGYNYDYKKLDNENIAQEVYIKLRVNFYAQDYLTVYYSYDNLFWWEFLSDPLKVSFLSDGASDSDIAIGLYLTGGTFASDAVLALGKAKNFTIKQYESVEEFEDYLSQDDMKNMPLNMSATTVTGSTPVSITYNVIKPGQVSLKVYDVYGVLKQTVMDEYKTFSKEAVTTTTSLTGLTESGIYLMRLDGPNNEQYVRFRYNAE